MYVGGESYKVRTVMCASLDKLKSSGLKNTVTSHKRALVIKSKRLSGYELHISKDYIARARDLLLLLK